MECKVFRSLSHHQSAFRRNRYIVECKEHSSSKGASATDRRNRYIVECKDVVTVDPPLAGVHGRNRYIVECKVVSDTCVGSARNVEIDTLWNVKTEPKEPEGSEDEVEIDTLWNVKLFHGYIDEISDPGRNRYIVECKVCTSSVCIRIERVEIDTLWNVK